MKKIIIIEGSLRFPIREAHKILQEHGYHGIFKADYQKLRKSGGFNNLGGNIVAIFCGPRPHHIKYGENRSLLLLEGTIKEGIPVFTCTPFTMNPIVKATKSSFVQTLARLQLWLQTHQNSEQ